MMMFDNDVKDDKIGGWVGCWRKIIDKNTEGPLKAKPHAAKK